MDNDNVVHLSPAGVLELKKLSHYEFKAECEAVGYRMAGDLCATRGFTPEMLMLVALVYSPVDLDVESADFDIEKTLAEAYGNLGIVRWCLDQRNARH